MNRCQVPCKALQSLVHTHLPPAELSSPGWVCVAHVDRQREGGRDFLRQRCGGRRRDATSRREEHPSMGMVATTQCPNIHVHMVLLGINIMYGMWHVLAHGALKNVPPLSLMAARTTIANVPIALLAVLEARRPARSSGSGGVKAAGADYTWSHAFLRMSRYCFPLGILMATICGALLFYGNERAGAGKTAAIQPALPVLSATLSWFLGRQRVSFRLVSGIALTVIGTLILANVWNITVESSAEAVGMALLFLQSVFVSIYLVGFEWVVEKEPQLMRPMRSYFLMNFYGSVVNLLLVLTVPGVRTVDFGSLTSWDIFTIFYGGVMVSGIGHACLSWSATRVSSTTSTVYVGIQAVFGEVAAGVILGESFGAPKILGSVIIVAGTMLVATRKTTIEPKLPRESETVAVTAGRGLRGEIAYGKLDSEMGTIRVGHEGHAPVVSGELSSGFIDIDDNELTDSFSECNDDSCSSSEGAFTVPNSSECETAVLTVRGDASDDG